MKVIHLISGGDSGGAKTHVLNRGGTIEVPTMEITYVVRVQNVAAELYEN